MAYSVLDSKELEKMFLELRAVRKAQGKKRPNVVKEFVKYAELLGIEVTERQVRHHIKGRAKLHTFPAIAYKGFFQYTSLLNRINQIAK